MSTAHWKNPAEAAWKKIQKTFSFSIHEDPDLLEFLDEEIQKIVDENKMSYKKGESKDPTETVWEYSSSNYNCLAAMEESEKIQKLLEDNGMIKLRTEGPNVFG
ncbi:uncharacterized protein MAM_08120 [Metarhizium album ARSEF 1941]|uniref:Uncharacterized protein n=1 Tax=Metarhizium album (strain ARSEF 1941) TaxID=1081103 RepID=A0A0B2WDU1_METAS|nr:uncharacterized protein MAM_08120 [Metarhizium album ARSEF 1941]KHN94046.1 hypothetical protein MAM_08120 [Metarhizium album ARSEF 1941]